jgi:hypothetical protein
MACRLRGFFTYSVRTESGMPEYHAVRPTWLCRLTKLLRGFAADYSKTIILVRHDPKTLGFRT